MLVLLLSCLARAASTPEEEALAAALRGNAAEAVARLTGTDAPANDAAAALYAIRAGRLDAAGRLLDLAPAGAGWAPWARVDLLLAGGRAEEAAALALARLDEAMGPGPRTALVERVLGWAAERRDTDLDTAARLLDAVIAIGGPEVRAAEDALVALPVAVPGATAIRLASTRDTPEARRVLGVALSRRDPARALELLVSATTAPDPTTALLAARALVSLPVPAALRRPPLVALHARHPDPGAVARILLDFGVGVAAEAPTEALAALDAIAADPEVGLAAREAAAAADPDLVSRQARWQALAAGTTTSQLGARAQEQVLATFRARVAAVADPAARAALATTGLSLPGAGTDTTLLYAAVPPGPGQTAALLDLARRFPRGPWCDALAEAGVRDGVDVAWAQTWDRQCDGEGAAAAAMTALAADFPWLSTRPADAGGGVEVLVTGVDRIELTQHRVDPEGLFAAGDPEPLAAPLDATLVRPDHTWSVPTPRGVVSRVFVPLRGSPSLAALTVRAGDVRTTTLVPGHRLQVVGVHAGTDAAIGVLDGARPVPGARLLVRDEGGRVRNVITGRDGIARVDALVGATQVFAVASAGVGVARLPAAPLPGAEDRRVSLVIGERGVHDGGEQVVVTAFAMGGADGRRLTLLSRDGNGEDVDTAEVVCGGGFAEAPLWVVPGGQVVARDAEGTVAWTHVPHLPSPTAPVAFTTRGAPVGGGTLEVEVWPRIPVPPEGLAMTVTVTTPWATDERAETLVGAGPVRRTVALNGAGPGDTVKVVVAVPDRSPVVLSVPVRAAPAPVAAAPVVPIPTPTASPIPVLSVLHRDHITRAWWGPRDADRLAGIPAGGGWVVSSDPALAPLPVPTPPTPTPLVAGTLVRGERGVVRVSGLPEGTTTWWWVNDGSDHRGPPDHVEVPRGWSGEAGAAALRHVADWADGIAIAAGLLAEEERRRELNDLRRLDEGFAELELPADGFGGTAMGYGGGGSRSSAGGASGYGRGGGGFGTAGVAPGVDARVLASGAGPAVELPVEVPPWVSRVWVRGVARTPDGTWVRFTEAIGVEGGPVRGAPPVSVPSLPDTVSTAAGWLDLALSLPEEGRLVALGAMERAGHPGAGAPWRAARTTPARPALAVLVGLPATTTNREPLADARRADRARQALLLASTEPERALAAARRLLAEAPDDDVRAEAGLALWRAEAPAAEVAAALVGDGTLTTVARALAVGPTVADLPTYTRLVWDEDADPVFRGAAAAAAARVGRGPVSRPAPRVDAGEALSVVVEPPLARWQGVAFPRGAGGPVGDVPWSLPAEPGPAAVGDRVPLGVDLPAHPDETRLVCPGTVHEVPASPRSRRVACVVEVGGVEDLDFTVSWSARDGTVLGTRRVTIAAAGPTEGPRPPVSPLERLGMGLALTRSGHPAGPPLLDALLREPGLGSAAVAEITAALLGDAVRSGDRAAIVRAFGRYRELVPEGDLDLRTAAAFAHAIAPEDPRRAVAAARVVMDGRFREELAAVGVIRRAGLDLTAWKLLGSLVASGPETPTVAEARALGPTLLLARADGEGDRLGLTRSSLRHTAAADLARFLLLHPEDPGASPAAALLVETLDRLGDPARSAAITGGLARRYARSPDAARLVLAEARVLLAAGDAAGTLARLASVPRDAATAEADLLRGRALGQLGRDADAADAWERSGLPEADARRAWGERRALPLPVLVEDLGRLPGELRPGLPVRLDITALALESLLLRDDGHIGAAEVRLDGLPAAVERDVRVTPDGDVPLPALPPGAWRVAAEVDGELARTILLTHPLEVRLAAQGSGTLIEVRDARGRLAEGASVWAWDGADRVVSLTTDHTGTTWAPAGVDRALAQMGARYGWRALTGDDPVHTTTTSQPASPQEPVDDTGYERLFDQARTSKVEAGAL